MSARRLSAPAFALMLASCSGGMPPIDTTPPAPVAPVPAPLAIEPKSFGATQALPPARANAEMARDFLDLTFMLESGQALPAFTRFEEPITIAVTGIESPALERELRRLMSRLYTEAGLPVRRTADPDTAAIRIEGVTTREMTRAVPDAACFVLPTRVSWEEFRQSPRRPDYAWSRLSARTAVSVFVPIDTSQQEIRDCLHEEIAQGLGPLNDLFRLDDSVFNDDNLNPILTGFDMLMLKVAYAPALVSGMTREEVAERLPRILAELNPAGETVPARQIQPDTEDWLREITRALSQGNTGTRRAAAERAVAGSQGWQDNRTALSQYTLGRLSTARDGEGALEAFIAAGDIYKRRPATQIHAAHVAFQVAAFALGSGQWQVVEDLADRYLPAARQFEDAALMSDLMLAKAAALTAAGRPDPELRRDALGWGVYAFGSEEAARARASEIEALARQGV